MPLNKQTLNIPFALGLDTKTDPWQLSPGNFLVLENTVFFKGKSLQKRNGFGTLANLPEGSEATTLTTYKSNLTAIGNNLFALSDASDQWISKGRIQPISLSVQSTVRTAYSVTAVDSAISSNNLCCTVFLDGDGAYKYQISDYGTGETLINATPIASNANQARVFFLGNYFVITFLRPVANRLSYIAIPCTGITSVVGPVDLSAQVFSATTGYDGYVVNNTLYVAWNGSDVGGAIRVTRLTSLLNQLNTLVISGYTATKMGVTAYMPGSGLPTIWVTAYNGTDAYSWSIDNALTTPSPARHTITTTTSTTLTSVADANGLKLFYQVTNTYTFSAERTDYIKKVTCSVSGTVGTPSIIHRDAGLGSKAFYVNDVVYMLLAHNGTNQPTYFLIDENGYMLSMLAYANGAGYMTTQVLPSANVAGNVIQIGYLYKTLVIPVNKSQGVAAPNNVYAQIGCNLVTFNLSSSNLQNVEIGQSLNVSGGLLWMYDGVKPVEQGFSMWPDEILATPSNGVGTLAPQQYYYQVTYEWTDGQGLIHRSAPSIPVGVNLLAPNDTVTLNIPTLRFTLKGNNVRIVIYRWSQAQQTYYQITSITMPLLNDTSVDSVTYTDTSPDSAIIGNTILYTTGGVVENIVPPGTSVMTLFNNRLFLLNDEDPNSIWYSKQVLEQTPVEMSDLFTIYVAPTSSSQGSSGIITALATMDDKLIIFKANSIYYLTGNGPDITGANNDFSEPVFITSTAGCVNPHSIVYTPEGLFFQSNKGIWRLGRNLSTDYIGAAVEQFNEKTISAGTAIPNTNEVRLSTETGVSMTIYKGLQTVLNANGEVLQETPGKYLDTGKLGQMLLYDYYYRQWGTFNIVSGPTTFSLTTAWFNLAGVQGFERSYWMTLLGQYVSPHKLNISIAYDYNPSPSQNVLLTSSNYSQNFGNDPYYGTSSPFGGPGNVEQWRIFLNKQKCQSFQVTITEIFDPQYGTEPGFGIQLTGLNLIIGAKSTYPRLSAVHQRS
jgi:hypothetical protein